jgi:transforming growth factor-beta-induced protein
MKQLKLTLTAAVFAIGFGAFAQTNVFDNVIATSPDHTSLALALVTAGLDDDLRLGTVNYTVFAPDNDAFDQAVIDLGFADINALLAIPTADLADILLYHVLDVEVPSTSVTNGLIASPLNTDNTIKLTVDGSDVYANQATISDVDLTADNGVVHVLDEVILANQTVADVALGSAVHTSLVAAVLEARLLPALTDPHSEYTVFAPDNDAFDAAVTALGVADINALLNLPDLADILLYHVLGSEVASSAVTNGLITPTLNPNNTLKLTVDGTDVYANQATVSGFDLPADNGVVHVLDQLVLPYTTVADVAIGSTAHTSLVTAVVEARLLPALTDPYKGYTVFAPTNTAFDNAVIALGLADINALLALPNLKEILLYHVLDAEVPASGVTNGLITATLNPSNTLKLTVDGSDVYANQSPISGFDLGSDNGIVHVLDELILPNTTVVDIAIASADHTSLVAALIEARLLPALIDPFEEFTVFAPVNQGFDNLATALGTDIAGVLANPDLAQILLYHVVSGTVLSGGLSNGPVVTLNTQTVNVNVDMGVMINTSTVTGADNPADNGVVHIIDEVLVPELAGLNEEGSVEFDVYPNPATDEIRINSFDNQFDQVRIFDLQGRIVFQENLTSNVLNIESISEGAYVLELSNNNAIVRKQISIK